MSVVVLTLGAVGGGLDLLGDAVQVVGHMQQPLCLSRLPVRRLCRHRERPNLGLQLVV